MTRFPLTALGLSLALALTGCKTAETLNTDSLGKTAETVSTASKALTLSDSDVVALSNESCAAMDAQNKVAPAKNKYTQRLNRVVKAFPKAIDGKQTNYKVYLTSDVNAWAMANGCIRVYSGLMDLMNDDELRGVIGHEIGHVALGHSKSRLQAAYATSAARQIAAQSGNAALSTLSRTQAGELAEKFLNAQFSQSQESASDDYSFDLLTQLKLPRKGLVTSFQKLAKLSEGSKDSALLSSHPPSDKRAAHMQQRLGNGK
ncbi:peptidase [Comamonas serinivorans]|uniref:Peptidase n=1 Tax=Comamonas serinivorans TaxID=1082851 RepID=A0A1Y0EJ07_9BURK|nr:M48 family metallopeptidase [Comamonas serinivorans]ARU03408.1 peptidase [Comamonas serinivorans]